MSSKTIIVLGRSGSGKGTQVKLLKKLIEPCLYIYAGDLFRLLEKEETLAGKKVKEVVDSGGLPPEWIAAFLWQKELVYKLKDGENIIFDGSPRRLDEAKEIDEVLSWLGRVDIKVVLIDITEDEAVTRLLKRGRKDDTEESIRHRLEWFNTDAMPAIEYYEKSNRLIKVDGMGSIEEIHLRIKQVLGL
ncbi:MAG: nucleoside monophosphate kinase [bacterium]|nr:nucleoside monophosphate kinase [bacterium]